MFPIKSAVYNYSLNLTSPIYMVLAIPKQHSMMNTLYNYIIHNIINNNIFYFNCLGTANMHIPIVLKCMLRNIKTV